METGHYKFLGFCFDFQYSAKISRTKTQFEKKEKIAATDPSDIVEQFP